MSMRKNRRAQSSKHTTTAYGGGEPFPADKVSGSNKDKYLLCTIIVFFVA